MGKYKYYYLHPVKATLAKRKRLLHNVALLGSPLLFLFVVAVGGILAPHSYAASYTWDGGGLTNNWSDCDNWSTNVCPVAADTVTFNGTSIKDSTIDGAWGGTLTGLTIASGYTGTITMDRSLTTSGAFNQSDGNFDATSQPLVINGAFTLSAGSFTASSSTTSVAGNFSVTGTPTFNANGGTFNFAGSTATVSCGSITFNQVAFTHVAAGIKTVTNSCSLPLGASPAISGRITVNGNLSGSGTITFGGSSTNTLGATGSLTGFTGLFTAAPLSVTGGIYDFGAYTTFDLNSNFILSAGAFTAPAGTASFAAGFSITGGSFNANGGTVIFDGGSATLSCGDVTFNLVGFSGGINKVINSNCNLPMGNDPVVSSGTITLNGTLSGTGLLTVSVLNLQATSSVTGFDTLRTNSTFTVNSTTADFSSFTSLDVNSAFILNNGAVFTAPHGDANFAAAFTLNAGSTFNANGGTIVFDGNSNVTIACNGATFNLVQFTHTGNTKTVSDGCVLPLGHDPTTGAGIALNGVLSGTGTLTRGATTINATGNITGFSAINSGTLTINGATIDWEDYDSITTAAFTASSTTLNWGGVGALNANGTVTLTGVTFNAPIATDINSGLIMSTGTVFTAPSGTMYIAGGFTLAAGATFNHSGGTVVFDGSGGTFNCDGTTFNYVVFNKSSTASSGAINANCTFPVGHDPVLNFGNSSANWTIDGIFDGSGVLTMNANTRFSSAASLSGFSGIRANIVRFSSGNFDLSAYSPVSFNTLQLIDGVSFIAPANELTVSSFYINPGTTFNANGGTVVVIGTNPGGTFNLVCNNAVFNLVRLEQNTRTVISNDCTLPLGNNPTISSAAIRTQNGSRQDFRLAGRLTGTGTLTLYGIMRLDAGYQLDGFSNIVADNVTVNNTTADLSSLDSLSVLWDLAITGSMTPPGLMSVGRNIAKTTGSTYNSDGGTVVLNGTDQTLTGDVEFYNLTKTTSGIVTVGAGNTITTTGLFKLSGPSLVSSAPGSVWNMNMQGSTNICGVSVTDSNSIGNAVVAYQSASNSANSGWVFLNSACPGSGGGGGGGTGGEPVSTVTNFTNAQAAATASAVTPLITTLPPYYGLPSTLAKTVDTIPGSREALRAFLRFVGITGLIMLLAGGIAWFVAGKRRKEVDATRLPAHWNGTRVG